MESGSFRKQASEFEHQMWRMLRNIDSWADIKAKFHGLLSFMDYFGGNGRRTFVGFTGNN